MSTMILDLPPELILIILSNCNIHQVHTFQLVSHAANQFITSHSESVYRALAIHYGLAQEGQDWGAVIKGRNIYFDFLKEPRDVNDESEYEGRLLVSGWREYVKRHFMLENNWREGHYVSPGHYDVNGLHRIQVDEVEGTILSTHTAGTVRSDCMQLCEPLWIEHLQHQPRAWAHCEFDNGFLIWGRRNNQIEVWRRKVDVISDPETTGTPDDAQLLAEKFAWFRPKEFGPGEVETGIPPPVNLATLNAPKPIRGVFQPFTILHTPLPTSAARFVYPHLVLTTRFLEYAYIYDIPANKLIKTIKLGGGEGDALYRIYYVEHSATHIFICTEDAVLIYGKEDGRLSLRLPANIMPHVRLRVGWEEGLTLYDPPPVNFPAQRMKLVVARVEETQYIPSSMGEFCAVHVSPCGSIWVIMNERDYILVVTGGAEDPTEITVVSVFIGDPALMYLAFDGHHIAVAGSKGIYVITLNRYRDPTLSVEAALTSLIKGHVHLVILPPNVDMRATSCLQVSDTAIWHVGRRSLRDFSSVTTKIDFAAPLDE